MDALTAALSWVTALPGSIANGIAAVLLLALLAWVWSHPFAAVVADAPPQRWRDLRLWATALVGVQLGLYWLFR